MKKIIKKKKKGQTMVEFTGVLGLSFLLIALMITGFQMMYTKINFHLAAYEGVRTAIVHGGSNAKGKSVAAASVQKTKIGQLNNLSVNIYNIGGNKKKCTVSADIKYFLPMIDPTFSSPSLTGSKISSSFTMMKER